MTLVAVADDEQWLALTASSADVEWIKAEANFLFSDYAAADAFFIMQPAVTFDFSATKAPVFINSVIETLQELQLPLNVVRINGWAGFLQRPVWEIAGVVDDKVKTVIEKINKKIIEVKDEPGLAAARIIAMVINEAYFALGDAVSTKAEIDTAMKLGTNYPLGPFEWAEKIGVQNIFLLLQKLSLQDKRYQPAPALIHAIQQQ